MALVVPHVDIVKASLGETTIQVLSIIFANSSGVPPSTPLTRFRADHPELMDELNKLGWSGFFLKRDEVKDKYRISGYALPLIDSSDAVQLLECMRAAYEFMQAYYKEHLREPLLTQNLINSVGQNRELVLSAFCYMQDIDGWWSSLSNEFPISVDSTITVNEQILLYKSFGDFLARAYEWNYVNPKDKASAAGGFSLQRVTGKSPSVFNDASASKYPKWYDKLDDKKKALLIEINFSIQNDLSALPMMGLRALLDSVMIEHVGDEGGFEEKLCRFEKNGYVTYQHANVLRKVLDAGHASMHRTYFPNVDDLGTCVDVVTHLLNGVYVLHPKVQDLAANTPPRPKSK